MEEAHGGHDGDEIGGPGGGATHIAITNNRGVLANYNSYRSEILIVAGGGGGGYSGVDYGKRGGRGGTGGGSSGGNGYSYEYSANYAKPGTQTSGYKFRSRRVWKWSMVPRSRRWRILWRLCWRTKLL